MEKKKFDLKKILPSDTMFYAMIVAVGVVILIISIVLGRMLCLNQAREGLNAATRHLKNQCEEYDNFLDSDEVKSLFHIAEQAEDIGHTLGILTDDAKDERLKEYITEQRINCIILTDENSEEIKKYQSDAQDKTDYKALMPYYGVREIIEYPKKIYSDRVRVNGEIYDIAAAARSDEKGLVICFRLQDEEDIENYYASVQKLLTGDKSELNGRVVVTNNGEIISSNSESAGEKVSDIKAVAMLDEKAKPGNIVKISEGKDTYYGGKTMYRQYGIYIYYPSGEVFSDCFNIVLLVFCIYFIIIMFMIAFHQRSKHLHAAEINEQYEIIRTISSMFLFNIFVDVKKNRFHFLLRSEDFEQVDESRPADDALKTDFTNYAAPEYRKSYREFIDLDTLKKRLLGRDYIETEYLNIHGEWLNDIIIPKRNTPDGDFDSFVLVTKNVNEQKKLEIEYQKRLEEAVQNEMNANKAKTDLLHRMSHDIRTPINAILGMIEMADRSVGDAKKQSYCRNQARVAVEYLTELVNDILTLNRIEAGDRAETNTVFNLKDEIEKIFTMVNVRAQNSGVILNPPKVSTRNRLLYGNVLYFHQIVINILTNAVKYSHEGGKVDFSLTEIEDQHSKDGVFVRFVCTDNGIGMSGEFQKEMFEPFAQENNEELDAYGGLGLGLAIVKKLVENLNGTILVQSEKGIGTHFTITVPFKYADDKKPVGKEDGTYSIAGKKILIAEDNKINMEIAEFFVNEAGAETVEAFDGKEAAEKFASSKIGEFDAILMDITMPVWDGLEATKKIRSMQRADAKTIPIIAMTANLFIQDIEKCMKGGMNGYLPKPINAQQLVKTIFETTAQNEKIDLKRFYDNIDSNYGNIKSCFTNEDSLLRFVKKFKDDKSFEELDSALKKDDAATAFRAAHTLKGVCANLEFNSLFDILSRMDRLLKEGDISKAKQLFTELEKQYKIVLSQIEKL